MEKTLVVLPYMCDQQRQEIDDLMNAADDIGAAATIQGGHGYNLLLQARERFKEMLDETMGHTRICIEEEYHVS